MKEYVSLSPEETEQIGKTVAEEIEDDVPLVALFGEMGAGKTAFVKGFVSVLSPGSKVKSPTYTVVNEYISGKRPVFHFDLYRLSGADDLDSLGFGEYLENGLCISEWSERIENDLPDRTLVVRISKTGESSRLIRVGS